MSQKRSTKKGWNSEAGYIWSMIGSAVGFANILSFGAKSYQNGGGAFLIPLLVAVLLLGLPMLILEGVIGKTFQAPLVSAFGKVLGAKGKFFAWPTIFGVITIGGFYTVLNTYSLAYVWFSATGSIPADTNSFFHKDFLGFTNSVAEVGGFSALIGLGSLALLAFVYKINSSPIASGIERLSKVFLPVLMALLGIFLIGALMLPGATEGIAYLLNPNFKVLADSKLWLTAFGHVFFSLSIGLAIISGYSAYTDKEINIVRSMSFVVLGDMVTSIVSALVIFGCLGHLAFTTGVPFTEVVKSSSFGIGFVVFPKLFQSFNGPIAIVVGTLFFFSLFLAGITGLISIIEAAVGNISKEFSISRDKATHNICILTGIFALGFSFGNGLHLIDVLDSMVSGINVLISGLLQIIVFLYLTNKFSEKEEWILGKKKAFYFYSLKYLSPLLIGTILISTIVDDFMTPMGLGKAIRWGWFALVIFGSYLLTTRARKTH